MIKQNEKIDTPRELFNKRVQQALHRTEVSWGYDGNPGDGCSGFHVYQGSKNQKKSFIASLISDEFEKCGIPRLDCGLWTTTTGRERGLLWGWTFHGDPAEYV